MHFYKQVIEYCKVINAPVSPSFIKARLKSHPDYPNLSSLTDTLDELEISYTAFVTDKSNYASLQYPMFVHVNTTKDEYFTVVKSKKIFELNVNNILENWDGTTIIIQNPKPAKNGIQENWLKKYKSETTIESFLCLSIAILISLLCSFSQNTSASILLLLSTVGLIASFGIFKFEIGLDSFVSKKLCSTAESCSKTLSKESNNWLSKIPLSDIGISYFIFQITYCCAYLFLDSSFLSSYPLIFSSLAATLFVIPSLYVQGFILKSWCRMCLLVLGILVMEGILAFTFKFDSLASFKRLIQISGVSAIILFLSVFSWLRVKALLIESYKALENYIDFQKWKRDPFIFFSLLYNQKRLKHSSSFPGMIMGSKNPKLVITMACSPFCKPCAATHKVLDKLVSINKEIQLDIKFAFSPKSLDSKTEDAMKLILAAYNKEGSKVVHEWFQMKDIKEFEKKYGYNQTLDEDITNQLLSHAEWSEQNNITHTPTLFLNGYLIPQQYNPEDLIPMINIITEEITVKDLIISI